MESVAFSPIARVSANPAPMAAWIAVVTAFLMLMPGNRGAARASMTASPITIA
jgi:hypothetical protein